MKSSGLSYDHYRTGSFDEWLMGIGSPHAPPILFLPALFEELNRTRALLVQIMQRVASKGYCCWLPDLPGTGESVQPLEAIGWERWRDAVKSSAEELARGGTVAAVASIRGGCLLDDMAPSSCVWRFAPVAGSSLLRDLNRAGLAAGGGSAGYDLAPTLIGPLELATPPPLAVVRTVRLTSDRAEADQKVDGSALWRRSEPETKSELAGPLADDLVKWMKQCAAS